MFGRKKKDLPVEARMMHYEGLPGFPQDGPCFMEQTEAGLVFRQTNGPAATTAHGKAVKWFAVFHYAAQDGERMLAFWWVDIKTGAVIQKLAVQIRAKAQDYTL